MKTPIRAYFPGLAMTAAFAAMALALARLPGLQHLGALSIALLLGLLWCAFRPVPVDRDAGIGFSAKKLLRFGIILLGVRLNFELVLHAGIKILLLDATVVTTGLIGINWLGRRMGLDPIVACLIAVDSSICGGSAVAAAAPTLRAEEDDIALVIPLCSLIGTGAMLLYTFIQHQWALSPVHYGMMAGATLHEVAQVMAAVAPFPETAELGTVTKLTRVVLLVPAVLVLGWFFGRERDHNAAAETDGVTVAPIIPKPWFVLGFLLVGTVNTLAIHFVPERLAQIGFVNGWLLAVANFLMAMAMAAMGLQIDFGRLRANGLRAVGTALIGWAVLASLAVGEIWLIGA
ncbi:MAG: putative sulfate exporter family transporter [Lacunisphaera sp.]